MKIVESLGNLRGNIEWALVAVRNHPGADVSAARQHVYLPHGEFESGIRVNQHLQRAGFPDRNGGKTITKTHPMEVREVRGQTKRRHSGKQHEFSELVVSVVFCLRD